MFILYDIIFLIFAICYLPILLVKKKWHGGFTLRLGFFHSDLKKKLQDGPHIWIHAVSVGEVLAIEHLINAIRQKNPNDNIVLTTVTKTGYALAQSKFQNDVLVIFAPLDFSFSVLSYIRQIKPKIYIAAETELWPNLFLFLKKKNIPIVIVNGRISDKSFNGYRKIKFLTKRVLRCVSQFCMQSDMDSQRIIALGANKDSVKVLGNIKFDQVQSDNKFSLEDFNMTSTQPIWIAGSTYPGEEEIVLNSYSNLLDHFPDLRLILAPRHVERAEKVCELIDSKKFCVSRLSTIYSSESISSNAILLVDTIGDLRSLYPLATVIFIGKSLLGGGGQNMIEPAYCAKPVIVGPLTDNFRDAVDLLKRGNGLIQIQSEAELQDVLSECLSNKKYCQKVGENARRVVENQQGALQKTIQKVQEILQ